ncbi:hypothetical protein [Haloferula sargassicola]|uniref:Uncharacterized protein n=1 Tax=Haloferula sargassicola TaxID=490096 RepID=A0ABP9UTI0_9BACT
MASPTSDDQKIFALLKDRLREAEAETRAALEETPPDHPLAAPARKLLSVHGEIRTRLLDRFEHRIDPNPTATEDDPVVGAESVQIEREQHHVKKNEFTEVVKALFMWRDDPVQRVKQKV